MLRDGGQHRRLAGGVKFVVLVQSRGVPVLGLTLAVAGGLVGGHDPEQRAVVIEELLGPGSHERHGPVLVCTGCVRHDGGQVVPPDRVEREPEHSHVAGERLLESVPSGERAGGVLGGEPERHVHDGVQRAAAVGRGALDHLVDDGGADAAAPVLWVHGDGDLGGMRVLELRELHQGDAEHRSPGFARGQELPAPARAPEAGEGA